MAIAALALACDRNLEPFDPDEKPRKPDLSKIFPESNEPEGIPAPIMGQSPRLPPVPGSTRSGGPAIRGTIRVSVQLGEPPAGAVLFIIARRAGAKGGPPLAVRRIPAPELPMDFEIGPEHVMVPSFEFEGEIDLSARLDSDGNATTRLPGDIQGRAGASVGPGATGVEIVLDALL
ncbi:MAG: hypothetical protein O7A09_07215 [Proteobacteria bacterium]|nr:hypothetical protein [Pseudomonadota bacterium]